MRQAGKSELRTWKYICKHVILHYRAYNSIIFSHYITSKIIIRNLHQFSQYCFFGQHQVSGIRHRYWARKNVITKIMVLNTEDERHFEKKEQDQWPLLIHLILQLLSKILCDYNDYDICFVILPLCDRFVYSFTY